jgi:hypothetical protein
MIIASPRALAIILIIILLWSSVLYINPGFKLIPVQSQSSQATFDDAFGQINHGLTGRKVAVNTSPCDSGLAIDSADPIDAAKAIDICKLTTGPSADWGISIR